MYNRNMNKKVTMQDIAKKLNISKVSVFKALNDKHDISDELKQKVIDCAISLDYKYIDPLTRYGRFFYYIIPKEYTASTEQFYFGIYKSLYDLLTKKGISIEMMTADDDFSVKDFHNIIENYHPHKINLYGVFWVGPISNQKHNEFIDLNIPIVCIDNYIQNTNGSFIYIDDYHAGLSITQYLINNGHRNICMVNDNKASTNIDKYFGFRKALYQNNIQFTENMHIKLSLAVMENFKYFKLPEPTPTAFLFDSDYSAKNFMMVMISKGYKIPEDFSVASFDNTRLSEETVPTLTSIGVLASEIADSAYKVMLKRLSSKILRPYMMILTSTISKRDSVMRISK